MKSSLEADDPGLVFNPGLMCFTLY